MKLRLVALLILVLGLLAAAYTAGGGTFRLGGAVPAAAPSTPATTAPGSRPPGVQATPQPAAPTASAPTVVSRAPGEITVEVDEATLTQQANANLVGQSLGDTPLGPASVRSVAIQLRDGQIRATGTAQVGPTPLPISLAATITAQAGQLRVVLADARLGGLPMPASARQYVEGALQAQVDQVLAGQQVRVRAVTVGDGTLTIVGARV